MATYQPRIQWLLLLFIGCGGLATIEMPSRLVAFAQDETAEKSEPADPATAISALRTKLQEEVADLKDLYQDATDETERQEIVRDRRAVETRIVDQVIKLTQQRDSASRNIRDLVWFFKQTKGVARNSACDELMNKYIESEDLTELVLALDRVRSPTAENESWMRELIEKSPSVNVQGRATMVLIEYLQKLQQEIALAADDRPLSSYLRLRTRDELATEIEALLTQCVEKYADVKHGRQKIGDTAYEKLTRLNLAVGKVAPDIVGLDLDDVEFKLSDYRGKVVVIDFWGDW